MEWIGDAAVGLIGAGERSAAHRDVGVDVETRGVREGDDHPGGGRTVEISETATGAVEQDGKPAVVDEVGVEVAVPAAGEIDRQGDVLNIGDAGGGYRLGAGEAAVIIVRDGGGDVECRAVPGGGCGGNRLERQDAKDAKEW